MTVGTLTPVQGGGRCSTRRDKHSFERRCWGHRRAGGCGARAEGGALDSTEKLAQRNGLEKVHVQRGFEYLRKVGRSPQVPRPSNAQGGR